MKYYFIRVFDTATEQFKEYDINTGQGEDMARLFAFLMDGGAGREFFDDRGMMELAKTYTDVVEVHPA